MRVIIDAYGGDHAPLAILQGTQMAIRQFGVEALICGNEAELRALALKENISLDGMNFYPASKRMPVEADPTEILKEYAESSIAMCLKLLAAGKGDAAVTAGSTGAAVVGSATIVKRMKGIKRPAIGIVMPTTTGCYMLVDGGANAECRPEMLHQFGILGSVYMEQVMNIEAPRVGIINIGTEENKGLDLQIQASSLLRQSPINFIGNVEARGLPTGACDVAVTDGFTGNVVLKLTEGMGRMMTHELKALLLSSLPSKIAAIMLKKGITTMRKRLDYSEYGGAPLMGISKPVIKAHGSSNGKAFMNAIRQAKTMHESDVVEKMKQSIEQSKEAVQ